MSIKIMQLVWNTVLPATEKLVLLALADNANDEGECYPSIATITRKCGLSERSVQRATSALESDGHMSRSDRSGRSTVYRIHPRHSDTPVTVTPPSYSHPTPVTVTPHPRHSDTHNHQRNRQVTTIGVHDSLPREAWDEWLAHRREKRWSMSPRALKPQLKLLAKYDTATQIEIIETSMQAGWQGVFPPKGKPQPPKKDPYANSV